MRTTSSLPRRRTVRGIVPILLILSAALPAPAMEILDLADPLPPDLPLVVDYPNTPVYVTNSAAAAPAGTATAASLTVADRASLHIGYDPAAVALGESAISVLGGMTVAGTVKLGKAFGDGPGLPLAATNQAVGLTVDGDLLILGGSLAAVTTAADATAAITVGGDAVVTGGSLYLRGAGPAERATLAARSLAIADGRVELGSFATLTIPATTATTDEPSIRVAGGGILELSGGTPPADPSEIWDFRGIDLMNGGAGMVVERGGILRATGAGGYIQGGVGEELRIEEGGALDASGAGLSVHAFDSVSLAGSYRAGYDTLWDDITRLDASGATVSIARTASLGMTRDLQRALNRSGTLAVDTAAILRGGDVAFEAGSVPTLLTGMGEYHLAVGEDPVAGRTALWVERVVGGVVGDGTAEDRVRFRANMENLWSPGRMKQAQAEIIYNLTAAERPSVFAVGEAGELNQAVLESFVDGRNMPVDDRGTADAALFEMYNGSSLFGVNSVAYNTASEVVATVGRRLREVECDLAAAAGGDSFLLPPGVESGARNNHVWAGAFGREEDADLDYGVAGYKYKPAGLALGYDRAFGSLAVGGALTYGRGNYRDKAAVGNDSKIASYSAAAYAAYYHWTGFTAGVFAAYSHLDNDLRDFRGGMRRHADHDSYAWTLGARIGREVRPAERVGITPSLGINKIRAVNKRHTEYLDGLPVIRFGEARRDSLLLPLDLALDFDLYRTETAFLRLTTNLGYAYDFEEGGLSGDMYYDGLDGAGAMPVADRDPGRHRFNFGAGLHWSGGRLDLGARYDYYRRADQDAHQVRGNLGVKF